MEKGLFDSEKVGGVGLHIRSPSAFEDDRYQCYAQCTGYRSDDTIEDDVGTITIIVEDNHLRCWLSDHHMHPYDTNNPVVVTPDPGA